MSTAKYIGAIDQGTTSTRFILFDHSGRIAASSQMEHRQLHPAPGWVEHDALEIWNNTSSVIRDALASSGIAATEIAAVGVTNQRETTVVWDRESGEPLGKAIVWQDTRTDGFCQELAKNGGIDRFREKTGLPLASYFSASKLRWLLQHNEAVRKAAEEGRACFGTIDSWIIYQLTGRKSHITDVTNASRTLLCNLDTLNWDDELLSVFDVPRSMLPEIRPSSDPETYGMTLPNGPFGAEIPITGAVGDQQAALFGQTCFHPGDAKNTYGTGCFLLLHTGTRRVHSRHGLITTAACRVGNSPQEYALEGSVAIAGALVQWARDNLGMVLSAPELDRLAESVEDNGGVYFVPAFSGLFAPYWRNDARGAIFGLTHYATKSHIARSILEATAYQTRDIFEAMEADSGLKLGSLRADGGMVKSDLMLQFQADILSVPVKVPEVSETTALGAAYAAGLAVGFWKGLDELKENTKISRTFTPAIEEERRAGLYRKWKMAVERTLGWNE